MPSQRFALCACAPHAVHTMIAEFTRQGFHDFELSIDDKGRLIISGIQGAPPPPPKKAKSPKRSHV